MPLPTTGAGHPTPGPPSPPPPPGTPELDFSQAGNSMYLPVIIGSYLILAASDLTITLITR